MRSTDTTNCKPQWEQLLSISTEIPPHYPFTATTLWMTNHTKAASFCALCLCEMIFHLKEVEGGISFHHLLHIDFSRARWVVIHFLPSLAEYTRKEVISCQDQRAGSQNSWSNFLKNNVDWVWALLNVSQSTLTHDIHPKKATGGDTPCIWIHLHESKVLQVDGGLREVPINSTLNCTGHKLNYVK